MRPKTRDRRPPQPVEHCKFGKRLSQHRPLTTFFAFSCRFFTGNIQRVVDWTDKISEGSRSICRKTSKPEYEPAPRHLTIVCAEDTRVTLQELVMQSQLKTRVHAALVSRPFPISETVFVAPDIHGRDDADKRKERLAKIAATEIVPRLAALHRGVALAADVKSISDDEISELAHLVLSPKIQAAAEYITILRERGLPMETLFVELLQPAAQHLGKMWDNGECDFIDVTLGVGQLQLLLSIFNCTYEIPSISQKRRVFLTLAPGEQHGFGLSMVAKLLRAAGWAVTSDIEPTLDNITVAVSKEWYAVAGVTQTADARIDRMAETIAAIRKHSRNPAIGVMVGGSQFVEHPELVARVGADGTAVNATTAVILTQKLFDIGAQSNWLALAR